MSKIKLLMKQGVWIASTEFYGVECVCTADSVKTALRGLQKDMNYIERELVIRVGGA